MIRAEPYSEAEYQLLIVLAELADPVETPNNCHYAFNPKTAEEARSYFMGFDEDWKPAREGLVRRGLIEPSRLVASSSDSGTEGAVIIEGNAIGLTEKGLAEARRIRSARPPLYYYYRAYYRSTEESAAHAEYCRKTFGQDLTQDGFSDTAQLADLIRLAGIREGRRILDIGCGTGRITSWLARQTGVSATGIDYVPEAIAQARRANPSGNPRFLEGNLDELPIEESAYDIVYSIDGLYMATDLDATLEKIFAALVPGGILAVFWSEFAFEDAARPRLAADATPLAETLRRSGAVYLTYDYSEANIALMRRKRRVLEDLAADYRAEGLSALHAKLIEQSLPEGAPYKPETAFIRRYLYIATRRA